MIHETECIKSVLLWNCFNLVLLSKHFIRFEILHPNIYSNQRDLNTFLINIDFETAGSKAHNSLRLFINTRSYSLSWREKCYINHSFGTQKWSNLRNFNCMFTSIIWSIRLNCQPKIEFPSNHLLMLKSKAWIQKRIKVCQLNMIWLFTTSFYSSQVNCVFSIARCFISNNKWILYAIDREIMKLAILF